jgi:hypothetical protein
VVDAKDVLLLMGTVRTVGVTMGRSSLSQVRASWYEEEEGAEVAVVAELFVNTSTARSLATSGRFSMAECLASVTHGGKAVTSRRALPKCRQEDDDDAGDGGRRSAEASTAQICWAFTGVEAMYWRRSSAVVVVGMAV